MDKEAIKFIDGILATSTMEYRIYSDDNIGIWWFDADGYYLMDYYLNNNTLEMGDIYIISPLISKFKLDSLDINRLMNNRMEYHYKISGFKTRKAVGIKQLM